MPYKIGKELALSRLKQEGRKDCLICDLLRTKNKLVLSEDDYTLTLLTRYPVRWGHTVVLIKEHLTNYTELPEKIWAIANQQALCAAKKLEKVLSPQRCYIASLGTSRTDLPMSSPHLHLHIVPIYNENDKPANVLTWEHGVWEGTAQDWKNLHKLLTQ